LYLGKLYSFGFLSIFDFGSRNLQTNDLVLELKPRDQHRVFLRAEVDGLRNYSLNYAKLTSYFDFLYANYIYRPSDSLALMGEVVLIECR
jgi:hypothetical protein